MIVNKKKLPTDDCQQAIDFIKGDKLCIYSNDS